MKRVGSLIGIVAIVLLNQSAWGIVRRHDVADSQYTTLAGQPQFAAVGKVFAGSSAGSGTVIANGWWVLTAAHVVAGAPLSSISFQIDASTYTAQNVYIHPSYPGTDFLPTADIALIELNAPVSGVTPALIYTGTLEVGKQGHSVGFGLTGTGTTGFISNTYGTKRAMRNIIDLIVRHDGVIDPNGTILLSDFDSPGGTNNSLGHGVPVPHRLIWKEWVRRAIAVVPSSSNSAAPGISRVSTPFFSIWDRLLAIIPLMGATATFWVPRASRPMLLGLTRSCRSRRA
jgi:hypothetical protein